MCLPTQNTAYEVKFMALFIHEKRRHLLSFPVPCSIKGSALNPSKMIPISKCRKTRTTGNARAWRVLLSHSRKHATNTMYLLGVRLLQSLQSDEDKCLPLRAILMRETNEQIDFVVQNNKRLEIIQVITSRYWLNEVQYSHSVDYDVTIKFLKRKRKVSLY